MEFERRREFTGDGVEKNEGRAKKEVCDEDGMKMDLQEMG